MFTPRKKLSSLNGSEEDRTRDAASLGIDSAAHYRLCYSGSRGRADKVLIVHFI